MYGFMVRCRSVKFWPDIDKQVMRDFADTVPKDLNDRMVWVWKTQHSGQQAFRERKTKGAVPHDMGVPNEDPFFQVNQFSWQDTNGWKDLNSKFVLMIYRDYVLTGSKDKGIFALQLACNSGGAGLFGKI